MTEHESRSNTPEGGGDETRLEDVTREQNGQFSMESDAISGQLGEEMEAVETAELREAGAGSITALQVSMEQSGADYINAQKAFLRQSGAKTIEGESSKLTQSGVLMLTTKKAELHESSAVFIAADDVQTESSAISIGVFEKATLGDGTKVGVMVAEDIEAQGDIHTFMVVGGDIKAGGSISSTMDAPTAAIFGAVFGAVFALVWKILRRA